MINVHHHKLNMKKKVLNSSSSYDQQIGGSYYLNYKIQPSKFVVENKL